MTKTTDTFPRNCEMTKGMKRMGYAHIERAHDAAIVEQAGRDGRISAERMSALIGEIEGHRYSFGPFAVAL